MKRSDLPLTNYGLVLRDWRTVYVVTPKAACTSMLWSLAGLQHESPESFATAAHAEVTRRLTVHDLSKWRSASRLETLPDADLAEIDPAKGWFVFGIARDPLSRLWSAWQSKLLLREPAFVDRFGDAAWFPRIPSSPSQIVTDFEHFVDAIARDPQLAGADPHWAPQSLILRGESFSHVGRFEHLEETYVRLEEHLHRLGWQGSLTRSRDNRSLLRLQQSWLSPPTLEAIGRLYANDYTSFGYPSPGPDRAGLHPSPGPHYEESVLGAMREIIARHERIGDLSRMLTAGGHVVLPEVGTSDGMLRHWLTGPQVLGPH